MVSEIRDSDIRALEDRVHRRGYGTYLQSMRLVKLRGFQDVEITFDFPVTALVGPNGSGKTTVLGAAALIYQEVQPRRFFAKSGKYDNGMQGWRVEYSVLDRSVSKGNSSASRTASYLRAKWNRTALARDVEVIGISRTLPASERRDLYKFVGGDFSGKSEESLAPQVVTAVERILGKDAAHYVTVDADAQSSIFALQNPDASQASYSEFHFGAGEASIIRIVSRVEAAASESLILIEEIENGLHPVATRRLVEYLIDVAKRKGCQVLFTTHSNDALAPLPSSAVWSAYRGNLNQGKLDVAALRTLTGQIEARLAVFAEDSYGSMLADMTLRAYAQRRNLERTLIRIHGLGGASPARDHVRFHNRNPVSHFPAIAALDGDKSDDSGFAPQVLYVELQDGTQIEAPDTIFFPGDGDPEAYIFERIRAEMEGGSILPKLTIALELDTTQQAKVREVIETRSRTNRDRHVIFAQIGEDLDFLAESIVARAFISTWANAFPDEVDAMWDPVAAMLPSGTSAEVVRQSYVRPA